MLCCPRFEADINYNGCCVPDSKIIQIAMFFLSPTRKCYKLHCFLLDFIITQIAVICCPRFENNTYCNSFVVTLNSQSGVILLRCHKVNHNSRSHITHDHTGPIFQTNLMLVHYCAFVPPGARLGRRRLCHRVHVDPLAAALRQHLTAVVRAA